MKLYGIKNCNKVKDAIKLLESKNISFEFYDLKKGIQPETIEEWLKDLDFSDLLNRKSTTWRNLDSNQKQDITKQKAINLMVESPTLIKRPVIEDQLQTKIGTDHI